MKLVYMALAWSAGILLAEAAQPAPLAILALLALGSAGLWLYQAEAQTRLIFLCLMAFSLGMARLIIADPARDETHLANLNDQGNLALIGVISSEPEVLDQRLRIRVEVEEAAGQPVHGALLVTLPRESAVSYGDRVRLQGFLVTPPQLDDFSYADYLARQGVFSAMFSAQAEVIESNQGFEPYRRLLAFKDQARQSIQRNLPEPQASLLIGSLLGDDSGIPAQTAQNFSTTGASHLIAISGFNMVIIAQVILAALTRLVGQRRATLPAILTIALYTLFVGASGSVVRAAIMSSLLIVAQSLGRRVFIPASMAFAVLLMSLYDPYSLWDVGFQLSLAAILGITVFVPPMQQGLQRFLEDRLARPQAHQAVGFLSDSLLVSLAAQLTTAPLIAYYFGRFSLVSLPVNMLTLPIQTPLLLLGALGTGVSLISAPVGGVILGMAGVLLTWMVAVVELFADFRWADTGLSLPLEMVAGFFLGLGLVIWWRAIRPAWLSPTIVTARLPVYTMQVSGVILLALLVNRLLERPDQRLHVTFLESGVLIETPQGGVILVDGGDQPSRLLAQLGDHLPSATTRLDAIILSAPSENQNTAVLEALARYEVGVLLTNGQDSPLAAYQAILSRAEEQAIPIQAISAGYTLMTDDGVQVEVLSPVTEPPQEELPTQSSLALRLTYGQAVFLLTGQADSSLEATLLNQPHRIQATVLQVPASASHSAMSQSFWEVVNPQLAVLQLEIGDEPNATQMNRLAQTQTFRTDEDGVIEVSSDGQTLWIERHR
jgi:competence protein ComEC